MGQKYRMFKPSIGGRAMVALTITVGMLGGVAAAELLDIRVSEKTLSGLEWSEAGEGAAPGGAPESMPPLDIRLVDMGGVGIPADTAAWGTTYSHATHAFDQLVLDGAPWIDPVGAERIREDWRGYVERMSEYGNNAVVLDAFLELVNFDLVGSGTEVYGEDDPMRRRHLAFRSFFGGLVEDATALGMDVYLKTDLPVATPALQRYFDRELPGVGPGDPAFWNVYGSALEEVFAAVPGLDGVVVRIGEGGPLFNVDGVEYASWVGVREPEHLRRMMRTLLPVFEREGRTMIFRSWSVGLGELGLLHNDPDVYLAALGDIDSPALVVSTKFVQGDYFGFLPLNPTLFVGQHRRMVEFQARREYEGFGALPNYVGDTHAKALRALRAANPNIVGASLWTQEGGPLRAGPLSLYHVVGFWSWTDASVYATSRLAVDSDADPDVLAEQWVRDRFGSDPEVVDGLTRILVDSRETLEKALYIRPYARQRVEVVGVELPPILWVFEWDVLAGWNSVLATLYRTVADDLETPIAEGYEALRLAEEMREDLASLEPKLGGHPDYGRLARSLEYQESLYRVLADFRAAFLLHYQWLDEGGDPARWRTAATGFLASAADHDRAHAGDLDFPAFDLGPAVRATERALEDGRPGGGAYAASGTVLLALLLGAGLTVRRRRLRSGGSSEWVDHFLSAVTLASVALAASALAVGAPAVVAGVVALPLAYAAALAGSWWSHHRGDARPRPGWTILRPLLIGSIAVLGVAFIRGPGFFWLLFWTDEVFRALLLGTCFVSVMWTLLASHTTGVDWSGRPAMSAGSVVLAAGFVLLLTSVMLPGLEEMLVAFDQPLQLLPMRRAIVNGITHYAGVSDLAPAVPGVLGATMMLAGGLLVKRAKRTRSTSETVEEGT